MKKPGFIALAALALAGCSTAADSTSQPLTVVTPGIEKAECTLQNAKYKYTVITPGMTSVERSRYPLTITCYKQDYITAVQTLDAKFSGTSLGNVMTGVLPGYMVDWHTGAMYHYPDRIEIQMKPLDVAGAAQGVPAAINPTDAIDTKIYEIVAPDAASPAPVENVPAGALPVQKSDGAIVVPGPEADAPPPGEASPQFDLNEKALEPPQKKNELGQDITIDDLEPKSGDEPMPIPLFKRIAPLN